MLRRLFSSSASKGVNPKVMVTAALNGVLTDPKMFNIPVTPAEMAQAAAEAHSAGASAVHVHFRDQKPDMGHMPSWDPQVASDCVEAIRQRVPGLIINMTTGTVGKTGPVGGGELGPTGGPISCLNRVRPDMAALNSGSLNYLKVTKSNKWAWEPMLFDNTVQKVAIMMKAMADINCIPECECFDTGILRSVTLYQRVGILRQPVHVSLVMGVESGMAANPDWLPLLIKEMTPGTHWQVIAIGQANVWPLLKRSCELGGNVRTGLEDTFYLPDGSKAKTSGHLIETLVKLARESGREPMTIDEAREHISKPNPHV